MSENVNDLCRTCLSIDRTLRPLKDFKHWLSELSLCKFVDYEGGICWECHAVVKKFHQFRLKANTVQNLLKIANQEPVNTLSTLGVKTNIAYDYIFNCDREDKHTTDVEIELSVGGSISDDDIPIINCVTINNENFEYTTESYFVQNKTKLKKDRVKIKNKNRSLKNSKTKENETLYLQDREDSSLNGKTDEDIELNLLPLKDTDIHQNEPLHSTESNQREYLYLKEKNKNDSCIKTKENNKQPKETIDSKISMKYKLTDENDLLNKFKTVIFTEEELTENREQKRRHPNFKKLPFKCDSCVLGFTRKETFDLHFEKSHSECTGKYQCKICETRFTTESILQQHTQEHYICHRCVFCKYESVSSRAVLLHCRDKHIDDELGRIHCAQCEMVVATVEELELHNKSKHTLRCEECGKNFKGKHTLRMHKSRIHNSQRLHSCDVCHKTFSSERRLESHMANHSTALAKKLSYCAICKVYYKNIYVYRNHLKNSVNHSERVYKCAECNKNFASKIYLQKHYDFYHLRISPHKCNICKKLFISEWRLLNHKQKHHGVARTRNHICNICGKNFFTSSTLRAHQLTHSEQRSFMCEDCGDTFKQRPALYTHSRLVHKGIKRKK